MSWNTLLENGTISSRKLESLKSKIKLKQRVFCTINLLLPLISFQIMLDWANRLWEIRLHWKSRIFHKIMILRMFEIFLRPGNPNITLNLSKNFQVEESFLIFDEETLSLLLIDIEQMLKRWNEKKISINE